MPMSFLSRMRVSPFAFPLALAAALVTFAINESAYQQATDTISSLGTQATARTTIQVLARSLTDAETGQRGYLLTGRTEYLRPYDNGRALAAQSLAWLKAYYGADPFTAKLMQRVAESADNKLSELAETIRLHDGGKEEAWHELLMSNIGKEQMDTLRSASDEILALESERVAAGRRSVILTLMLGRIGVAAMTALSLFALFMYLRQASALVIQREEQRRIVQAERDRLEIEVARRTDRLTELARHLQTAREDERARLGRELHDELGALLTAAKLDVARLKSRLGVMTPEVIERLQHLNEALNAGIALKRRIIEDLRPSSLSNLGLVAALEILLREWSASSEVKVDSVLESVRLQPSGQLTVYRMVQEALTNISKYAQASHVQVKLTSSDGVVHVSVRDDGIGFDTELPRASAHGLLGMLYRLEAEGGRMLLSSTPGQGTLIEAQMPESDAHTP